MARTLTLLALLLVTAPAFADEPKDAAGYYTRGLLASIKKDSDKAIADFTRAIELDPKMFGAYLNRGIRWQDKGEFDKAIIDYSEAMNLKPKDTRPIHGRMHCWLEKREYGAAILDAEKGLEVNAEFMEALNLLGWTYATCPDEEYRDGKKAVEYAKKAIKSDPKNIPLHETLAGAHAEAGDFGAAVKEQQTALDNKEMGKDERTSAEKRLELYRAKKPYRTSK